MCCYVGKATKIFLCLATALLVAGLVLGFGLARRTWGADRRAAQPGCRWPAGCQLPGPSDPAVYGADNPLQATTTAPPSDPLTEPAVAVFPGTAASSTAVPPASGPYFAPPSPFPVGLGPSSNAREHGRKW